MRKLTRIPNLDYHLSMLRSLLISYLSVALLACPTRCSSGAAVGDANGDDAGGISGTASSACGCCSTPQSDQLLTEDDGNEVPPVENTNGICGSCLCHGAIAGKKIRVPTADVVVKCDLPPTLSTIAGDYNDPALIGGIERNAQFAGVQTGRDLCARICVYLN